MRTLEVQNILNHFFNDVDSTTAAGVRSVLKVIFSVVPLEISFLPGSRVAVVSAHQPVELPRKLLTEPWD